MVQHSICLALLKNVKALLTCFVSEIILQKAVLM